MARLRTLLEGRTALPLLESRATLLDPEAILNACYRGSYVIKHGQWGLPQPYQRPKAAGQKKRPWSGKAEEAEEEAEEPLQQLQQAIQCILQAHQHLLALLNRAGPLQQPPSPLPPPAAAAAAAAPQLASDVQEGCDWCAVAAMKQVLKPQISFHYVDDQGQQQHVQSKLFGAVVHNPGDTVVLATAFDRQVLLPARSSFCMSDLMAIHPFVTAVKARGGADLLLIDPPWENASAKRAAYYNTLTPNHLLYLPIKQLLKQRPGSLVALWMTNRPRHRRFVLDKLLPAWGLHHAATWFWLKVTDKGEQVSPLGSLHRHPFEQLWLARSSQAVCVADSTQDLQAGGENGSAAHGAGDQSNTADAAAGHKDHSAASVQQPHSGIGQESSAAAPAAAAAAPAAVNGPTAAHMPDRHVLISVPGQHSRKPCLLELLLPLLSEAGEHHHLAQPVVAELFARELFPGVMAWGNEAVKFQEVPMYWGVDVNVQ